MSRPTSPQDLVKYFPAKKGEETPSLSYRFNEEGEGLCYYENGRVALAVNNLSAHQSKYYIYDDDQAKTMVCSLNEYAVGFAVNNTRGHKDRYSRLVLTKTGGVYADAKKNIIHQWKWDRKSQNSGIIPPEGIHMSLNKNLTLHFDDRFNIEITYGVLGITKNFSAGLKLKRMTSYLDTARSTGLGRLEVQLDSRRSLNQRQDDFSSSMSALRNKNNPKSHNLSSMVSEIVSGLENHFDTYEKDKRGVPSLKLGQARTEAFNSTCGELPKIRKTEQDIDMRKGYSDALYIDKTTDYEFDAKKTARKILVRPDGKWRTDLEIRQQLMNVEHPPNRRPRFLQCASGHYSYSQPLATGELRENNIEKISTVPERAELRSTLEQRMADMVDFSQQLLNKKQ
ncbi:hypothetical protein ScalyP_jg3592 [Parmales sp. scaly parma]|nr:hypothetical protein ScalyP_jg3592 [Parmales sp. scaly parma]